MGEQAERALLSDDVDGTPPEGAFLPRAGSMSLGPVPRAFSLARTARSHGWCALPPFCFDAGRVVLYRTVRTPDAGPLTVRVTQRADGRLTAAWGRVHGSCDDRIAIKAALRRCLALDDDLAELHALCAAQPQLTWVCEVDAGRLLRSPTVFEDLAKTLATTNCSWALTEVMAKRMVESLGERGPEGEIAFPTPESFAAAGEDHFRDEVRAGYRARAFVELGEAVASGRLDPERWWDPAMSDDDVMAEVLSLRGFGPYAAQGMLGLLGRPRGLALDSWVRAKLPRLLGLESMSDDEIAGRYAPHGRWAGALLWLELTSDWFPETAGTSAHRH